jgi:hypothetical protein
VLASRGKREAAAEKEEEEETRGGGGGGGGGGGSGGKGAATGGGKGALGATTGGGGYCSGPSRGSKRERVEGVLARRGGCAENLEAAATKKRLERRDASTGFSISFRTQDAGNLLLEARLVVGLVLFE